MALTFAERAARLANHPDTIRIELAGESMPCFFGKLTFDLGKQRDINVGTLLNEIQNGDAAKLEGLVDSFGKLLYLGMLPFDENLAEADVTDLLSLGDMKRLGSVLKGALNPDDDPDASGKA